MKILVLGGNGQLGSEIKKITYNNILDEWIFTDMDEFNLLELKKIHKSLQVYNPEIIINCAAYTNVDQAEIDKDVAEIINYRAIEEIAIWCQKSNAKLIHISTDYVFDGTSKTPLTENAKPNPINTYGKTKLQGDLACLNKNPSSIILRTSWVYSIFGNNFLKTMISLMSEKNELNIIDDQIGSPTYAKDLAETIIKIIYSKNWTPGLYNYSNEGETSWYEFALCIKELIGSKIKLKPIKSNKFFTLAKRPKYSLLDKTKIKKVYNLEVPNFVDSLKECIIKIKNEK